ncbi:hypothetical protein BDF14DRAFT_1318301 [Spinellus fusiger]|nr:hypothetical protein BDF14DRAFT_1318301 [Spinellus fusiger]
MLAHVYVEREPTSFNSVIYCYYCGNKGHYGDECGHHRVFSKWQPSAFSIHSLESGNRYKEANLLKQSASSFARVELAEHIRFSSPPKNSPVTPHQNRQQGNSSLQHSKELSHLIHKTFPRGQSGHKSVNHASHQLTKKDSKSMPRHPFKQPPKQMSKQGAKQHQQQKPINKGNHQQQHQQQHQHQQGQQKQKPTNKGNQHQHQHQRQHQQHQHPFQNQNQHQNQNQNQNQQHKKTPSKKAVINKPPQRPAPPSYGYHNTSGQDAYQRTHHHSNTHRPVGTQHRKTFEASIPKPTRSGTLSMGGRVPSQDNSTSDYAVDFPRNSRPMDHLPRPSSSGVIDIPKTPQERRPQYHGGYSRR